MQFRELYKQRVIEAVLGGGRARRFHAYVDGHAADHYTRYGVDTVTTSFGSRTTALAAARRAVDSDISQQSYLRRYEPKTALEWAEKAHRRAVESLDGLITEAAGKARIWVVPDRLVDAQQCVADAELRVKRTQSDLELAAKALARSATSTAP
jgi:hypothetical protein